MTGVEPLSGRPHRATDPENQLWVHVTSWHSALYAYERYGGGPLSTEREERYWRECAIASELQDLERADVPCRRPEVREYFDSMRPSLGVSELARAIMHSLLVPPHSWELMPVAPLLPVLRAATVATIPCHMRRLGGFDQPQILGVGARPLTRMTMAALSGPVLERLFAMLAPEAYAVAHEALHGRPPLRDEIVSPPRPAGGRPAARRSPYDPAHPLRLNQDAEPQAR